LLNIQTLDDDADLDLCASLTPDGKNIYVTAVNRNATSDRTLKLSVADFKGPARAALNLLVPLASDAEGKFVQQNKKLKIIDGKIVSLKIPSRGIARVCFGSPERIESKSANMKAKKISE
jgi:alpha-L-arabinofuranosidase